MTVIQALSYTGLALLFINTVLYCIGLAKKGRAYIFFVLYLTAVLVIQAIVEYYAAKGLNNHFISTYYLFAQFILLSFFYYYVFINIKKALSTRLKITAIALTVLLVVQYCIHPELYYGFNSIGFLVTSLAVIVYSVAYLYEQITTRLPYFYITVGILIYFISSAIIFASASSIVSFTDEINMFVWKINAFLFIIYQLLILREWIQIFYRKAPARG